MKGDQDSSPSEEKADEFHFCALSHCTDVFLLCINLFSFDSVIGEVGHVFP